MGRIISEKNFIQSLKNDLPLLLEDSFQRNEPDYYDERVYYNEFHKNLTGSMLHSDAYKAFVDCYITHKQNLYTSIQAFIEVYEELLKGESNESNN